MATSMEEIYAKIIIHRIIKSDLSPDEKYYLLIDFHCNCSLYYDLLCDYTYLMVNSECDLPLWVSINGRPHLSLSYNTPSDVQVLDYKAVPLFEGDLVDCLHSIFRNLSICG